MSNYKSQISNLKFQSNHVWISDNSPKKSREIWHIYNIAQHDSGGNSNSNTYTSTVGIAR